MAKRRPVSKGETEVLKALWSIKKGSISEIHAAVSADKQMDYSTVQTYMRRLESKGYVDATRVGRNKVYRANVRRTKVMKEAVEEFVDRLFDGQMLPMVRHLVDGRDVTAEELSELKKIVDQLRKEQSDDAG